MSRATFTLAKCNRLETALERYLQLRYLSRRRQAEISFNTVWSVISLIEQEKKMKRCGM